MKPTRFEIWKMASRPKTLPAAAAPVLAGTVLAIWLGAFRPLPALAALLGALLLQIGANFANDLFDYEKGADTSARLGPVRVTQSGLLRPAEVRRGMMVVFGLAALCGVYLIFSAGWVVALIGVLAILSALAYTGGPYPLGYHGLGEVFVFLFFGLAAVFGTVYVQAHSFPLSALWTAIPVGLLASAILVVNNLRDIETDRQSGKMTLAARFGAEWARREYLALVGLAFFLLTAAVFTGGLPIGTLGAWIALPLAVNAVRGVWTQSGRALNPLLGLTGQVELVFCIGLGLGLILQTKLL